MGNYFWILGSENDGEDNIQKLNGNNKKIAFNWLINSFRFMHALDLITLPSNTYKQFAFYEVKC